MSHASVPRVAVCLLPCLLLMLSEAAHAADSDNLPSGDFLYRAQPRDTLIGLGRRLLLEPRRWRDVQERNHIVNPRTIPPGSILRIPYAWLRLSVESATVANVSGSVLQAGKSVAPGDTLSQGSVVETGADGSVTLDLADGSVITLQKSSVLDLGEMAQVNGVAAAHSLRLKLNSGRVEAKVKPHHDVGRFEIMTPVAASAVRGTEFRDSFDAADLHSTAETLEGTVSVAGAGSGGTEPVPVAQGFGTRVEKDQAPLAPIVLLPPPSLAALPATSFTATMSIQLPSVPGAQRYRIQLSTDAEFHALSADVLTPDGNARIPDLPDGEYWLRARSIDALTIEGSDAAVKIRQHALPPAPKPSNPTMGAKLTGSHLQATWEVASPTPHYTIQVATNASFTSVLVDHAALSGTNAEIDDLAPGSYFWRVAAVNTAGEKGPWSEPQAFALRPAMPMPDVPRLSKHAIEFTWAAFAGQTYRAQLSREADFDHPLKDQLTTMAAWSVPKITPGIYFIRVQAIDSDGTAGPFGPARRFTVPVPLWMKIVIPVAAGLAFLL